MKGNLIKDLTKAMNSTIIKKPIPKYIIGALTESNNLSFLGVNSEYQILYQAYHRLKKIADKLNHQNHLL
jgi:hypothetical protein